MNRPPLIPPPMPFQPPPPPPGKKPPMLKWPAIFGVLALIAVQLAFGKPLADNPDLGSGSSYLMAYHTGAICAGVLISLLLTWIIFRVTGRSQMASHATFFALIGLFSLSIYSQHMRHKAHPTVSREPTATFPTFGIALAPPADWKPVPADRDGMIAKWISAESNPANPSQVIEIVLEIPSGEPLATRARRLASDWGATRPPQELRIDNEPAWEIHRNASATLQPVQAIITSHHDHFYVIYGTASAGKSVDDQMEFVQSSWRWTALEPPSQHLELGEQPISAFDGRFSFKIPAIANTVSDRQQQIAISVFDVRAKALEFDGIFQLVDLPPGDTIEAASERLATGVQKKHNLPEPFVWHTVQGPRKSIMTQPLAVPGAPKPVHIMWAMAQLDGNQIALVNFSLFARDPIDRSNYVRCAQKIIESISIAKPARP